MAVVMSHQWMILLRPPSFSGSVTSLSAIRPRVRNVQHLPAALCCLSPYALRRSTSRALLHLLRYVALFSVVLPCSLFHNHIIMFPAACCIAVSCYGC